jgi:hypothetical protein
MYPIAEKLHIWVKMAYGGGEAGLTSAAGFETYDRFILKKVVLYAFFIIKNGVKNVL